LQNTNVGKLAKQLVGAIYRINDFQEKMKINEHFN